MIRTGIFAFILLCAFCTTAQAQRNPAVMRLHHGNDSVAPNPSDWRALLAPVSGESVLGSYYRFLTFEKLPSPTLKAEMLSHGIRFVQYIPDATFFTAIPETFAFDSLLWVRWNLRAVKLILPEVKIKLNLREPQVWPDWTVADGWLQLSLTTDPGLSESTVLQYFRDNGIELLPKQPGNGFFRVRTSQDNLLRTAALPFVTFVEPIDAPATPENQTGKTLHRSSNIDSDYAGGRKYSGDSVNVAMGDDGVIGPHIDYTGRVDNSRVSSNTGNHGDHVGGTIMGAGNLNPKYEGMASGADLLVYDVWDAVDNSDTDHGLYGVMITSTSYSNGCNAGYTSFARFADQTIRQHPSLLHVFSAGNEGATVDCGYGAGAGWGNVTGGVKIGKNVVTVANVTGNDILAGSSSRGPATDGRIKPDVAAKGSSVWSTIDVNDYASFTGTSMACPGVSGTFAQLYHAYRELNGGNNPPSGLLKAIVLNTAEDLGNPGPDFKYGYGRINALRTVTALEETRYTSDTVSLSDTMLHSITVPPGTSELRVMVYWHDFEGASMANPALVNDLDITLTDPSSAVFNPWVLDPTPTVSALDADAVRGVDNLNNQEQVTIKNPLPGVYDLRVMGTWVPMGPQEYFVTWQFTDSSVVLTHPVGGEGLVPGESERLRWDADGDFDTWTIEYSPDSGATWNLVTSGLSATRRYFDWTVPNVVTGKALMRITRGAWSDVCEAPFSIIRVPADVEVTSSCPDYCIVSWDSVPGAVAYEVSQLGAKYMDSIGTTAAFSYTVSGVGQFDEAWFSVKAIGPDGARGRRAIAVYKETGLWNCMEPDDAGIVEIITPASGVLYDCFNLSNLQVKIRLSSNSPNSITDIPVFCTNGIITLTDTVKDTLTAFGSLDFTFSATINMSAPGVYNLSAWCDLPPDANPFNDSAASSVEVVAGTLATLPHTENFETFAACSQFLVCGAADCPTANGWYNASNNQSDDIDFRGDAGGTPTSNTGPDVDHNPGTATGKYVYLESSGCYGREAQLLSPCFDLSSAILPELRFWMHLYGSQMGELHLDVLKDGEWHNDVIPVMKTDWGNKWWERVADLSPWKGGMIAVRFRGITGNETSDLAIDDISIVEKGVSSEEGLFSGAVRVYPNPSSGLFELNADRFTDFAEVRVFDIHGREVWSRCDVLQNIRQIPLVNEASGVYLLSIRTGTQMESLRLVVE